MRKILIPGFVAALAILPAFQGAGAAPGDECPPGWEATDAQAGGYQDADANGDNIVCTKEVEGEGNTGDGGNVKDNRSAEEE